MRFLLKTGILFPWLLGLLPGTVEAQQPAPAGVTASALGIAVPFHHDPRTGPVVVCVFGLLLFLAYLLRRVRPGRLAAG